MLYRVKRVMVITSKISCMKKYRMTRLLFLILAVAWGSTAFSQYDDLYYDPDTDGTYYDYSTTRY